MRLKRGKQQPRRRLSQQLSEARRGSTPVQHKAYSSSRKREEQTPTPRRTLAQQNEPKKSRKSSFLIKGSTGLLLLAGILLGLYLLILSPQPSLVMLGDSSETFILRDGSQYETATRKALEASFWNRSKVTINTQSIEDELKKQFPELAIVNVVVPFLGTRPIVYIEPSAPALLLESSNGTYLLNDDGRALILKDNLPEGADISKLSVVTDQSNLTVKPGQNVLTGADVVFIKTILAQLDARQVRAESIRLPGGASEVDIKPAGLPYVIKFNLHDKESASLQAGTYLALKKQLESKGITPSQYVDVRLTGRAYYK